MGGSRQNLNKTRGVSEGLQCVFQKKVALPLISPLTTLGLPINDSFAKVVKLYQNGQGCVVGLSIGITEKGGIMDKKIPLS